MARRLLREYLLILWFDIISPMEVVCQMGVKDAKQLRSLSAEADTTFQT